MQQRLVAAVAEAAGGDEQPVSAEISDDLTPRELEVLKLIASGLSNAEIAQTLVVSGATVKTHVIALVRQHRP